jgi:pilus assembly protein TadC
LAACLHAGAGAEEALASVAETLGGPLQDPLSRVVLALRAGSDAAEAWELSEALAPLSPVARAFVRASRSGAPLAATMSAVADEQRRVRRWQAEAAARKAGVLAVAPLVLCFLPAFILIGVVPVIVGVATEALAVQ